MGMYSTNGAAASGGTGGSGGGPDMSQAGNGIVVYHNGQWTTCEIQATAPLFIHNGHGLTGNPRIGSQPWLARSMDLDLSTGGDKPIIGNAFAHVPHRVVLGMAHGEPPGAAITGGLYTKWGKGGVKIYDLPNAEWQKLTDDIAIIECNLVHELRTVDYLYLYLDTPNAAPLKVSAWVFGDNLEPNDIRGRPT